MTAFIYGQTLKETVLNILDNGRKSVESLTRERVLTPEAARALAEAAERRRLYDEAAAARPREVDGRGGAEPVRFGDWEVKGLATDF